MDDNENLFSQFTFDSWSPKGHKSLFSPLEDALARLETSPNLEAAFTAFWKILEKPDPDEILNLTNIDQTWDFLRRDPEIGQILDSEAAQQMLQRLRSGDRENIGLIETLLSDLVVKLKPNVAPDGHVRDVDAWIFATVSGAAAIQLERADSVQTERLWELVESAVKILEWSRPSPWCSPNDYLGISNCMVASWLWTKLFSLSSTRSDEGALECLYRAILQCEEADDFIDYLSEVEGDYFVTVDDWMAMRAGEMIKTRAGERLESGPGMLAMGAGYHLITHLVSAQEAVETFERLLRRSHDDTDWGSVSLWCRKLSGLWHASLVASENFQPRQPARDYWLMASGLALKKMTPDQLDRYLQSNEMTQAKDRLRSYFLEGIWEKLPESSQQALIAADRFFSAPEGRRYGLASELRLAVEPIVEAVLVAPFKAWLDAKSLKFNRAVKEKFLPLSRQIDELWVDNRESFERYLKVKYPSVAPESWTRLSSALLALRENRSRAEHPEDNGGLSIFTIKNLYGLFLGIERKGIIRMLMELDIADSVRHEGL